LSDRVLGIDDIADHPLTVMLQAVIRHPQARQKLDSRHKHAGLTATQPHYYRKRRQIGSFMSNANMTWSEISRFVPDFLIILNCVVSFKIICQIFYETDDATEP
jgi:hypothetical protein